MEPQADAARSQNKIWLILWVAFVARLVVVSQALSQFHIPWFYTRGSEMGFLADSLVRGKGLSSPFGQLTGHTALIAPGYPLLVSGVFKALGSFSIPSALVLIGINLLLNVTTVWLVILLARQLASERAALTVGAFWACSPPLLGMATIFWETSFSIVFLLSAVVLALRSDRIGRPATWFLAGLTCGLAALFNPALAPSLLGVLTLSHRARSDRRRTIVSIFCGFCLAYAAWPIRNAVVFHAPILTRTTVGLELWMGNHPGSDGYLHQEFFPTYNPGELRNYIAGGELSYVHTKQRAAHEYVRQYPGRFLGLTGRRILRFWGGYGTRHLPIACTLHALVTSTLGFAGVAGLLRGRKHKQAYLVLLPLVLFPVPYYLTHADLRYRLLMDPLLTAAAAKTLDRLASAWWRLVRPRSTSEDRRANLVPTG